MKNTKQLFIAILMLFSIQSYSQIVVSVSSPSISVPYQVASGTSVTFNFSALSTAPNMMFSSSVSPTVSGGIPPDATWIQHSNFTANADGTYSLVLTVNSDIWVWGGISGFIGWQYSNVVAIQTVSAYAITASDTVVCMSGDSVTFNAPYTTGTYQWYNDTNAIATATDSIYYATSAGVYHCEITIAGSVSVTNSIAINNYDASFTGSLLGNQITLTADQNFNIYQWYSRSATGTLSPISGATNSTYTTGVTSSLTYYTFIGQTSAGCDVTADERFVVDTIFLTPIATLNTTLNANGNICDGTPTSIVASNYYGNISWEKNGIHSYSNDSINLYGSYQNGTWIAKASSTYWPEIQVSSNALTVNFAIIITPVVTGANYYQKFCAADVIPLILTDEGYTYSWYVNDTIGVYGSYNQISVPTSVYQHTFSNSTHITIVASYLGCEKVKSVTLNSWNDTKVSVNYSNYTQKYLCTDSAVDVFVPSWDTTKYDSYQWYEKNNGVWDSIIGSTIYKNTVNSTGLYKVEAIPKTCASAISSSDSIQVFSYLDRKPYTYATTTDFCEEDTIELHLSSSSVWYAIQWQEASIGFASVGGFERVYSGMLTNSGTATQEITELGAYIVSAKHTSCPNGLKVKSDPILITPKINSKIILTSPLTNQQKYILTFDSAEHYIGCFGDSARYTLTNTDLDSIEWYELAYSSINSYGISKGTQIGTGDSSATNLDPKWITAYFIDSTGCKSQTTPILLDTYVFSTPDIASSNNSELCNPGDSTLLRLGFPGNWDLFEWQRDGISIPNSDNDSIWAKVPGTYTLLAFPSLCPTIPFSSGTGPTVKYLYASIFENDTLIYAMPELGYYSYQWYFNGDSIDFTPNIPWIIMKDSLQNGIYTVEVSNENCTKLSTSFIWTSAGMSDVEPQSISIYPNPTNDIFHIEMEQPQEVSQLVITDMSGREVMRKQDLDNNSINIEHLNTGIYIVRIEFKNGLIQIAKISKSAN